MPKIIYDSLGRGLRYPFTTTRTNGVLLNESMERINQSLFILFETEKGSRINQPRWGSSLEKYRFDPFDEILVDKLDYEIRESVRLWEPRVFVDDIEFKMSPKDIDSGTLYININYHLINTDVRGNYVYPYRLGTTPTLIDTEV